MVPNDERVLILAATTEEESLICEALQAAGLCAVAGQSIRDLADGVIEGAAAELIAEEALRSDGAQRLIEALGAQPAWSDLPLIILTNSELSSDSDAIRLFHKLAEVSNLTLLERPLRVMNLLMTVQASVRVRRRQYEFREYLQQQERYEEQVQQTQKLESLGVLAGGIAHDFNNILTGILGNASLAAEILPDGHEARHLVEDVISASERAAGLTRQMLAYAGKGQFVHRPVDLSEVVRNLSDFFRASVPKRVEVSPQLAPDLPAIEADTSQLQQIVMNLVMNAAEAIPEGRPGKVEVITGTKELQSSPEATNFLGASPEAGAYAFLQITDDGTGMDEQTLARIFDPFFTTKFMGRGLGLAAVQGIVRGHRGALAVESTPGKGTTFTVFFPASKAKPVLVSKSASAVSAAKGQTILIVDDEEIVRRTAAAILEKQGYSVITAENGKVAVDIFRRLSEKIGVLLLDVTMPVMDGEETFHQLKVLRPDVKVILSSGYNETEALRRFTHGGQAGFIQKPYTSTRLLEKIRSTLETGRRATGVSL